MRSDEGFTLGQASLPMRLMTTLFIVGLSLGLLSAQINLNERVGTEDGIQSFAPSFNDVKWHFAGNPHRSRLSLAISPGGLMADKLDDAQRQVILGWVDDGAPREAYQSTVLPIIQDRCMRCHESADGVRQPKLVPYEEITKITGPGPHMSVARLALLSHIHFLGMTMFLGLFGVLLWLTHAPTWIKLIGMTLPILGSIIDLGSWWLTALVSPVFAVGLYTGGVMRAVGVIPCIVAPLWEMWFRRR
jgi:hypothetical protein